MAHEQNMHISFSSSSDESSDEQTPFNNLTYQQAPPLSTDSPTHLLILPPSRKPRGRPPGSKNKPKPPLFITQDTEQTMKPAIIEIAAGTDVLEAVIQFAVSQNSCLSILSGSGTIAKACFHYPLCQAAPFTAHGPFSLLTLTGTFLFPPTAIPPTTLSLPVGSSSVLNPNPNPVGPSVRVQPTFAITLAGMQGQIFGGIINGKLVSGGDGVQVIAALYKNPDIHRAGGVILEEDDVDEDNNPGGNGGAGGGDPGASSSGGAGGSDNVFGFNVFNPFNFTQADPNVMQWNHPRPPNY